jgi:hypothetical protein
VTPARSLAFAAAAVGLALSLAPAARAQSARPGHFPGDDCARCHSTQGWERLRAAVSGFEHGATGFPLRGAHAALTCDRCHDGARGARGRSACATCHADPHRGEQGEDCARCHDERSFAMKDALLRHRETRFPLTGAHALVDCGACHLDRAAGRFAGVPTECLGCHLRDYQATTSPNHVASGFSTRCDDCHRPTAWRAAKIFHDRFFPLTGAHATTPCASCHQNGRYAGTPTDCYACHQADYAATTNPVHASAGFGTTCRDCHSTSAWQPSTFDHERFFPISSGPHRRACTDCHLTSSYASFDCLHCHTKSDADHDHLGKVSGYVYDNAACYRCHPRGTH